MKGWFTLPRGDYYTHMHKHSTFTLAVLAGFLFHPSGAFAQISKESTFDCGTIRLSPSGNSMTYQDLGLGFRFEFPSGWEGRKISLSNPSDNACTARLPCPSQIMINPLLATSDPKFYVSEGARVTGSEVIKGQEWTALAWPDGRRGYYAYHEGVAIEFVAWPYGKSKAPSAVTLATLNRILSSFSFLDDASRLDRQLSALHVGQKLGGLTIERKVPGTGGFGGNVGRIEFSGRLTLTGKVHLEGTMRSSSGYFIDSLDDASRSLVPLLSCPVDEISSPPRVQIKFSNQDFAEQQFGKQAYHYYLAQATVIVDNLSETFYSAGVRPSISARLIEVTENKPIP